MTLVKGLLEAKGAPSGITGDIQFTTRDRTPEKALSFSGLGGLIPYMLIIYIFSGALMIGIASTTAEKEKGSFSLLLLNRVDRGSIAIGKVAYVMVTGMMNSVASAAGMLMAGLLILKLGLIDLSKFSGSGGIGAQAFSAILSPWSFILFLLNLVVVSALFSSAVIIVGLRSKTVKEANGYAMPLLLLILLAVIPTISSQGAPETRTFLIPVLNTAYCLKGIFEGTLTAKDQVLCLASNGILIGAAIYYVRQLFSSEKILYTV
jgi:sodium transport system permease protein